MALPPTRPPTLHTLPAMPETVHWGYFDRSLPPVLTVRSGDLVAVEALTHHAGDAPDLLMDDGIRAVYAAVTDRGPGVHIMTGPIAVEGAEPGDTLEVRILHLQPRLPYGSNFAAWWGLLYDDFARQQRVTIYEISADGGLGWAAFAFDFPYSAEEPGAIVAPESVKREQALANVVIPLRPHFGTAGVAPAEAGRISSIPPAQWGGNIDNWRIGAGGVMYYPVFAPGALLSVGDPHVSQGDGEISGTAVEASLNATLQLVVRKDFPVHNPVLETATHWYLHAYHEDLDEAMRLAALEAIDFLGQHQGLSRADAYSLLSVAGDFTVTQVVDQRKGIHVAIAKNLFLPTRQAPDS